MYVSIVDEIKLMIELNQDYELLGCLEFHILKIYLCS